MTPEKKTRRRYSDREIATALAVYDTNGSLTETARLIGIADSTLSGWVTAQRKGGNLDITLMREGFSTAQLADNFESIAHHATGEVKGRLSDPKQVKDIPMHSLLKAAEVGTQNSQLLRGLPTSIVEERVEPRRILILMSQALGIVDPKD